MWLRFRGYIQIESSNLLLRGVTPESAFFFKYKNRPEINDLNNNLRVHMSFNHEKHGVKHFANFLFKAE